MKDENQVKRIRGLTGQEVAVFSDAFLLGMWRLVVKIQEGAVRERASSLTAARPKEARPTRKSKENAGTIEVEKWLNERELSRLKSIPAGTLQAWRHQGEGPRYCKVGRSVKYHLKEVLARMESHAVPPRQGLWGRFHRPKSPPAAIGRASGLLLTTVQNKYMVLSMKRMPDTLSASQLAKHAGLSRSTVYKAVQDGDLHPMEGFPFVVFTKEEAKRWLKWLSKQTRPGPKAGPQK